MPDAEYVSLSLRTRDERIAAQKTTHYVELADGLIGLLDGDNYPIEVANRYFRKLRRQGKSRKYVKNLAYTLGKYIRTAGASGFEWLNPPDNAIEDYFYILLNRPKNPVNLASATSLASRIHQIFKFAIEIGSRSSLPYETKVVTVHHGGRIQQLTVPAFLPAHGDDSTLILPSAAMFRAWHEALPDDARLPAEILQKVGLRLFEVKKLIKAWFTRVRSASGAACLKITRKGNRKTNVYVPSQLADKLDLYLSRHTQLLRFDGKPWSERTLSEVFRRAKKAIGVNITAHILRHAYGSWAFARAQRLFDEGKLHGHPILVAQELLGHASPSTTLKTYVHIFAASEGDLDDVGGGPLEALIELMEPAVLAAKGGF